MLLIHEGEPGDDGKWETVDRPDEPPTNLPLAGGGLAKVNTDACGVCGTDFHAFYGKQVRSCDEEQRAPSHSLVQLKVGVWGGAPLLGWLARLQGWSCATDPPPPPLH